MGLLLFLLVGLIVLGCRGSETWDVQKMDGYIYVYIYICTHHAAENFSGGTCLGGCEATQSWPKLLPNHGWCFSPKRRPPGLALQLEVVPPTKQKQPFLAFFPIRGGSAHICCHAVAACGDLARLVIMRPFSLRASSRLIWSAASRSVSGVRWRN